MKSFGYASLAIAAYAAVRLIDLVVQLTRLGAGLAVALALWYLVNPEAAASRLTALWLALTT